MNKKLNYAILVQLPLILLANTFSSNGIPLGNENAGACTGAELEGCTNFCPVFNLVCDVNTCLCKPKGLTHVALEKPLSHQYQYDTPASDHPYEILIMQVNNKKTGGESNNVLVQGEEHEYEKTNQWPALGTTHSAAIPNGDFMCELCKEIMEKITEEYLQSNQSKEAVDEILKEVCDQLPEATPEPCYAFMEMFGGMIVEKIVAKESAEVICESMMLCSSRPPQKSVRSTSASTVEPLPAAECRNIHGDVKLKDAQFLNSGCMLTCSLETGDSFNHTEWNGYRCSELEVCSEGQCQPGPAKGVDRTARYNYGNAQIVVHRAGSFSGNPKTFVQLFFNQTSVFNTTIISANVPVWNQNFNSDLIYESTIVEFRLNFIGDDKKIYVHGGGSISIRQLINRGLNGKECLFLISDSDTVVGSILWTHQ